METIEFLVHNNIVVDGHKRAESGVMKYNEPTLFTIYREI